MRANVLVAEDSLLIAMDIQDIIGKLGCDVVGPISSVAEAVACVQQGHIDIAIIDFMLRDGSAELLAETLDAKGVPFAFCSGMDPDGLVKKYSLTPLVGKPYQPEDVVNVVRTLMSARLADGR